MKKSAWSILMEACVVLHELDRVFIGAKRVECGFK